MTTNERRHWLEARRSGLGASDMPNLIGVGYGSPLGVYRSKVEPVADLEPTAGPLARGIALEPIVAEMYAQAMQCDMAPCSLARHPSRPWQMATPDYQRHDTDGYVQIKTTAGFGDEWGPSGTDVIPPGYRVQVTQEMGVTGATQIDVAALDVIAWELRVFRLAFDPELFDWLTDIGAKFWREHVVPLVPPGLGWDEQFKDSLPPILKGSTIDLGDEVAKLLDRREHFAAIEKEASKLKKEVEAKVKASVGQIEMATAGPWTVKQIRTKGGTPIEARVTEPETRWYYSKGKA